MDEEAIIKKRKKSRRTTKRKKEMHPEIKESLKLSDKGSYYKQEDFYYSTDESIPVNLWELLGGRSPPYQLF